MLFLWFGFFSSSSEEEEEEEECVVCVFVCVRLKWQSE